MTFDPIPSSIPEGFSFEGENFRFTSTTAENYQKWLTEYDGWWRKATKDGERLAPWDELCDKVDKLIAMVVHEDDQAKWKALREGLDGHRPIAPGQVNTIRQWISEVMFAGRPPSPAEPSLNGPGNAGASSPDESSSLEATPDDSLQPPIVMRPSR